MKQFLNKFRKEKDTVGVEIKCFKFQFDNAICFIKNAILYENNIDDKLLILKWFMDIIKNDLISENISSHLYQSKESLKIYRCVIPYSTYDENGNEIKAYTGEYKEIHLEKDFVHTLLWKPKSSINMVKKLKSSSFIQNGNHQAHYFEELDLCYAYNGLHSISAGVYHKQGKINAEIIRLNRLFPYVSTDGLTWLFKSDYQNDIPVKDFRFAVLFETARIKHDLINAGKP